MKNKATMWANKKTIEQSDSENITIIKNKNSDDIDEIKTYFLHLLTILNDILYFPTEKLSESDESPTAVFLRTFAKKTNFNNNFEKIFSTIQRIINTFTFSNHQCEKELLKSIKSMLNLFRQEAAHIVICGNQYASPFAVKQYNAVIVSFEKELDFLYCELQKTVDSQPFLLEEELKKTIILKPKEAARKFYKHSEINLQKPSITKEQADEAFLRLKQEITSSIKIKIKPPFKKFLKDLPDNVRPQFQKILDKIINLSKVKSLKDLNENLNSAYSDFFSIPLSANQKNAERWKIFKKFINDFFDSFQRKIENNASFGREIFQNNISERLEALTKKLLIIEEQSVREKALKQLRNKCFEFFATINKVVLPSFYDQDKCLTLDEERISPLVAHQHMNRLFQKYSIENIDSEETTLSLVLALTAELVLYYPSTQARLLLKINKIFDETEQSIENAITSWRTQRDLQTINIKFLVLHAHFKPPTDEVLDDDNRENPVHLLGKYVG